MKSMVVQVDSVFGTAQPPGRIDISQVCQTVASRVLQLRTILGVSSSLYSDAYLGDIVDASENLVLPMLVTFQSKINKVKLTNNIAYFETATIQEFTEGQSVIITGCGAPFNGTHTVTDDEISDYVFTVAITNVVLSIYQ